MQPRHGKKERRLIGKAEYASQGANPRFVVTSLESENAGRLYDAYCKRGQAENYIKDLMNAMVADRLSCSTFEGNFFRLLLHSWAYRLMWSLREGVRDWVCELNQQQELVQQLSKTASRLSNKLEDWAGESEAQRVLQAGARQLSEEVEKVLGELRREKEARERLGQGQFDTLRLRLLKVAVHARERARRVWCQLPNSFVLGGLFRWLLERGQALLKPG